MKIFPYFFFSLKLQRRRNSCIQGRWLEDIKGEKKIAEQLSFQELLNRGSRPKPRWMSFSPSLAASPVPWRTIGLEALRVREI